MIPIPEQLARDLAWDLRLAAIHGIEAALGTELRIHTWQGRVTCRRHQITPQERFGFLRELSGWRWTMN